MTMFRRLKKSLQRRAWCMGTFLCREIDEDVYTNVRHRLKHCGGAETRVKLSAKGWSSGGGRNMPSQFYSLDMINAVQPDTVFLNVLLCVFRRGGDSADFPFETVAFKFDSVKGPNEFHQLFKKLCPPERNRGSGVVKKASCLPVRGTAGRNTDKQRVLMPGRPTQAVMGEVAPDRWTARNRATPRLFASRSMEDLLEENMSKSSGRGRCQSMDNLDNELSDDDITQTSTCSTPTSLQPVVLPADIAMEEVNGALDGAWWSEDDELAAVTRTKDVGIGATFPDASDHRKQQRQAGLEVWVDGDNVACQAYVLPAPSNAAAAKTYIDDDDYDAAGDDDEFKWVFSSDDEDEEPVFDADFRSALVNSINTVTRNNMTSPSDPDKHRYTRTVDQQKFANASRQNALAGDIHRSRPVSQKSPRWSLRVPSHALQQQSSNAIARSSSSLVRHSRSDTSAAAALYRPISAAGATGLPVYRRPVKARSVSARTGADRRRRVQSMSHMRSYQYQYDTNQ